MKFGFVTCVQLGLSCIESVLASGGSFDLLITLHDHKARSKSGRIYLDDISRMHQIPLLKVNHINDQVVVEEIKRLNIDWLFIIGWSQIAGAAILQAPNNGVIGAHPTLLPEGRGRAAIPWAIIKGLEKTGVTFFKMDTGVDTGEVVGQIEIPLNPLITSTELYSMADEAHVTLIKKIWPRLLDSSISLTAQDERLATYWDQRKPSDGELFPAMTVQQADRLVRASTRPYPGAFFYNEGKLIRVWSGKPGKLDNGFTIQFSDGVYTAFDYNIEPSPDTDN